MNSIKLASIAGICVLTAACQNMPASADAQAKLVPKSGSNVAGVVSFSQSGNQVVVTASVSGLKPNVEHGFHIHEKGDCSAADATSAGGHFNPTKTAHGHVHGATHHAGDMPNIKADAAGNAQYQVTLDGLSLKGADGIVGRAVVVHRDPDDYKSQPAGNSGPRIACGVIQP